MKITVFGPLGHVGSQVVNEALARGHDVTGILRNPQQACALPEGVAHDIGDVTNVDDVRRFSAGQDALVSATRPKPGAERELVAAAKSLQAGVSADTRLFIVGGAATLIVPGAAGRQLLDDKRYVSDAWRAIAVACADQLDVFLDDRRTNWVYVSPPAFIEEGARTGKYQLGVDELVVDAEGKSSISYADLAVAIVDELEQPAHQHRRFTVGYV